MSCLVSILMYLIVSRGLFDRAGQFALIKGRLSFPHGQPLPVLLPLSVSVVYCLVITMLYGQLFVRILVRISWFKSASKVIISNNNNNDKIQMIQQWRWWYHDERWAQLKETITEATNRSWDVFSIEPRDHDNVGEHHHDDGVLQHQDFEDLYTSPRSKAEVASS